MIEVYKILHGIYDSDVTGGILQLSKIIATRGHALKLATQPSRLEIRRNIFTVRVVKPWNSLPQRLISKLKSYGINSVIIKWITAFLLARKQT